MSNISQRKKDHVLFKQYLGKGQYQMTSGLENFIIFNIMHFSHL